MMSGERCLIMYTPKILESKKIKANLNPIPQPAVASFTRFYAGAERVQNIGVIAERLKLILRELGLAVRQGGGFIGHIKAFVSFTEGGSIGLSVVKDQVTHQPYDLLAEDHTSGFKVAVTAIVYGYTNEELARLLNLALAVGLPESVCQPVQVKTQNLKPIVPFCN